MSLRSLLACAAVWVLGCGGNVVVDHDSGGGKAGSGGSGGTDTTTTLQPDDITAACHDYCDAVTGDADCFTLDDCHARCMAFYSPGCEGEVEAVLACLPEWLTPACQITYADLYEDGCGPVLDDLWFCGAGALYDCVTGSSQLVGETACQGFAECPTGDLEIDCSDTGECQCSLGGAVIGKCSMPFSGAEPCSLPMSCCRDFVGL